MNPFSSRGFLAQGAYNPVRYRALKAKRATNRNNVVPYVQAQAGCDHQERQPFPVYFEYRQVLIAVGF
ncbi:MAG: hypothetical protein WB561_14575 [Terracidiphilus sp.]